MVENVGLSLKERMAALQSASKSSSKSSPRRENKESPRASVAVAVAATGAQLKAGFLKRSAGEGKLADVFYRRFTALYSDPMLCFFEDEERSRLKGSVHLVRGTTCESGATSMVLVSVPASGDTKAKQLKLQFPTAEEAAEWLRALTGALAEAYPQAPAPAPAPAPVSTESVVLTTQPAAAAPAPAATAPPEPTKRGSSFWRPTFHETSIMMGGVELGGENAPPRRKSSFAAPVLALARSVSKLLTRSPSSFDGDLGDGDLESMSDSEDEEEKERVAAKARAAAAKKARKAAEKAEEEARAAQQAAQLAEQWAIEQAELALKRAEKAQRKRQARQKARQKEAEKKKAAAKKKAEKRAKKQKAAAQ